MILAAWLFRFQVAVMVLLHLLGFFAPWNYFTHATHGTLWLAASTLLARTGWLGLEAATLAVTLAGLACLVTGTALRLWGTSYLGTWFIALPTALLMPSDGASFFLVSYSGFLLILVAGKERAEPAQPHWTAALLNEIYPLGFTLCFAIFAWRYNARILIRCLLISYGLSLVAQALKETTKDT